MPPTAAWTANHRSMQGGWDMTGWRFLAGLEVTGSHLNIPQNDARGKPQSMLAVSPKMHALILAEDEVEPLADAEPLVPRAVVNPPVRP